MSDKMKNRIRRHRRVRAKIYGTAEHPRLSVFRSNQHIYAQLIDDAYSKTLAAASDVTSPEKKSRSPRKSLTADTKGMGNRIKRAYEVGKRLAEEAQKKGIERVVFDRGGFHYHGRVKALADGAREGGLRF